LRPWIPDDLEGCLAVARSNTPAFVLPHEVAAYGDWLRRACGADADPGDACAYFVVDDAVAGQGLAACGGIAFAEGAPVATLCWGLVRRDLHRRGLGTRLLVARLALARARGVEVVALDTTPASLGFFLRHGFVEIARTPDGYGPGLDRVDVELRLKPSRSVAP
jgi:GNAT superfamily N-acetyltransferase